MSDVVKRGDLYKTTSKILELSQYTKATPLAVSLDIWKVLDVARADLKRMLAEDAGVPEDDLYLEGLEAEDYRRVFVEWFRKWFGEKL